MSAEFEAQILADLRRTHAQLNATPAHVRDNTPGHSAWSMRLTIEEVDLLLSIVAERDDLKRRLVSDWEPDLDDEPGVWIKCNAPEESTRRRRCTLDAGHEGDHSYPKTIEDHIAGTDKKIRELGGIDGRTENAPSCPFVDTVHDCPLGGCPDASTREVQIPDLPAADLKPHVDLMDALTETLASRVAIGREARETPPHRAPGRCSRCHERIYYSTISGAWVHSGAVPEGCVPRPTPIDPTA